MWVALRSFRYRNTTYQKGDTVPAEGWPNRRALSATHKIQFVPDVIPPAPPVVPSKLKRVELNEYASSLGIEDPEGFPNRESLLERVNEILNPAEAGASTDEISDADEDVDPFADLDDSDEDDEEDDPERIEDDDLVESE